MPAIDVAVQQLVAENVPVLLVDTCILLDIIRAPVRGIHGCIKCAVELADMQAKTHCRIVASSLITTEWSANEVAVIQELNRHLELQDHAAIMFHEACALVNVPVSFSQAAYKAAGLTANLRDLSKRILDNAICLDASAIAKSKATDRTLACLRPARKGGGLQDCIIVEEYMELCQLLQNQGFMKKVVFCSSNTKDYQDSGRLDQTLATEFQSVGLIFTNALHWAIGELKKP